ncbi:MAG: hypothetical protein OFPI_03530 [Osedax symbiont Rs2]|nr:MAG: hypothetical protein OFPI_03530 [Osedax symbiont Rs2]
MTHCQLSLNSFISIRLILLKKTVNSPLYNKANYRLYKTQL